MVWLRVVVGRLELNYMYLESGSLLMRWVITETCESKF